MSHQIINLAMAVLFLGVWILVGAVVIGRWPQRSHRL